MPQYRVLLGATVQEAGVVIVEAENEAEAGELALEATDEVCWESVSCDDTWVFRVEPCES